MLLLTGTVFFVFGVASIAGGALGFKKAGSRASLVAGVLSGVPLMVAAYLTTTGAAAGGLLLGGVLSLALGARFIPGFIRSRKVMPHGVMAGLSVLGTVVSVAAYAAL